MKNIASASSFALSSPETEATEELMSMVFGFMTSQAIAVVSQLGITDFLQQGPKTIDELAELTHSHSGALYRVMRALAAKGVYVELEDKAFDLAPMGRLLGKSATGGIGKFTEFFCADWHWHARAKLDYSVRTGKSAFEHLHQQPLFDFLAANPDAGQTFNDGMTSFSATTVRPF